MSRFDDRQQRWEAKRAKWEQKWANRRNRSRHSRAWMGLFLILVGTALLLRHTLELPGWLFTWPVLLIAIGFFSLVRNRFQEGGGLIMMLIGGIFLAGKIDPTLSIRQYIWPSVLIVLGIWFLIKPRRKSGWDGCGGWDNRPGTGNDEPEVVDQEAVPVTPNTSGPDTRQQRKGDASGASREDYLDFTSVFGGVEKTIFSKNFRGGDIVNIFGGANLNLSQADIQDTVTLDMVQIFGGTSLVVPPDWDVKSEMTSIFGGLDDKRNTQHAPDGHKVLLLKGTTIFGGVELKNF